MGYQLFDQYSILHFAVGVIMFFWQFSFWIAFGLHFLFEMVENTPFGMKLINKYFVGKGMIRWPGGKYHADSVANIIGDNVSFILGFIGAQLLNHYGVKYNWHQ